MDARYEWLDAPLATFRRWQETDATGADRRRFAPRSAKQHAAMFARFMRHLHQHGATVASFGDEHLESYLVDLGRRSAPGTTTALRYAKLIDRLCRHLIELDVRNSNPAARVVRDTAWPDSEPVPVFLDTDAERRLENYVRPRPTDIPLQIRDRAIVALLLGTGITAAEFRAMLITDVTAGTPRPYVDVEGHGPRPARRIALPQYAAAALRAWLEVTVAPADGLLFPSPRGPGALQPVSLWATVHAALEAVDVRLPDMSPRVLRNTYARRLLLTGKSNDETSRLLGLASHRTVVRLRATIPAGAVPA
jgi:site-specific recombinase XerD